MLSLLFRKCVVLYVFAMISRFPTLTPSPLPLHLHLYLAYEREERVYFWYATQNIAPL